jgi:hypothetical protein
MTAYDNNYLHDTAADTEAKHDAALDAAREAVVVTGYEFGICLSFCTQAQADQFFQMVVDSNDQELRHMVRLICADVIERKARQMVEVRK